MHDSIFIFFNDTATTEIYTLALHDALPIYEVSSVLSWEPAGSFRVSPIQHPPLYGLLVLRTGSYLKADALSTELREDRKSTRLNSSHANISYAVFCLKK